jgi:hypothetical protein
MTNSGASFPRRFIEAYADVALPAVYYEFITSGAYLPLRRSLVDGLAYRGPNADEVHLDDERLLNREALFGDSDIDLERDGEYHPIAIIPESGDFLVIDKREAHAPVYLFFHETEAFLPQFDSFETFVKGLRAAPDAAP